jgi:hypothetical protein
MKLKGERLGAQESVSKCLQCENKWPLVLERYGGAFYSPQENLAVGVLEIRICPGRGLDMSGQPLCNPAWGPDMFGLGLSR